MSCLLEEFSPDPARFALGTNCPHSDERQGEGDISASYSGDRIPAGEPIRKPFNFRGHTWVTTSMSHGPDRISAEAYRLLPPQLFDGQSLSYRVKTNNGEKARADPMGFYHAIKIHHRGEAYILTGPPITLSASVADIKAATGHSPAQLDLL